MDAASRTGDGGGTPRGAHGEGQESHSRREQDRDQWILSIVLQMLMFCGPKE